jgi:hypothetical protein
VTVIEQIVLGGAFVAALTAISLFAHRIYKIAKRIDGALGVDKEGRTISERLQRVEHQLFPNGGSSLTDKINRVEFEQREMKGEMSAMKDILRTLLRRDDDRTTGDA